MDKIFSFKNLFALIVIMVLFLALKDDGFIEYQTLLNNQNQLSAEINKKTNELYDLKKENKIFKKDDQYIEKIAREKYFYLFPKETIINF